MLLCHNGFLTKQGIAYISPLNYPLQKEFVVARVANFHSQPNNLISFWRPQFLREYHMYGEAQIFTEQSPSKIGKRATMPAG